MLPTERLALWMSLGPSLFLNGPPEFDTLRNVTPPVVYLAELGEVLDEWRPYVAVDERTCGEERAHHYRAVGQQLAGVVPYYNPGVSLYNNFNMLEGGSDEEHYVLQGIRHNALLQMIARGDWRRVAPEPDITLINWDDVVVYGSLDWLASPGTQPTVLIDSLLTEGSALPFCERLLASLEL